MEGGESPVTPGRLGPLDATAIWPNGSAFMGAGLSFIMYTRRMTANGSQGGKVKGDVWWRLLHK